MKPLHIKEQVSQWIAENETEKALNYLLKNVDRQRFPIAYEQVVLLHSRHKKLEEQSLKGILSFEQLNLEQARINNGLLELVRQIEQGDLPPVAVEGKIPKMRSKWVSLIPLFLGLLLIALVVRNWSIGSKAEKFDLDIYFYGDIAKSNRLGNGSVLVSYEGNDIEKKTDQNGKISLRNLRSDLREDTLTINPQIKGYNQAQLKRQIPKTRDSIEIILEAIPDSTLVKGNVLDNQQKAVANALVTIDEGKTYTDKLGNFQINVPLAEGANARLKVYIDNQPVHSGEVTISSKAEINVDLK